jgi:hypothetical protein
MRCPLVAILDTPMLGLLYALLLLRAAASRCEHLLDFLNEMGLFSVSLLLWDQTTDLVDLPVHRSPIRGYDIQRVEVDPSWRWRQRVIGDL